MADNKNTKAPETNSNLENKEKVGTKTETKNELADNLYRQMKEKEKDFISKYGKNPSKEDIVKIFQTENPDLYNDKNYEEILDILKNGTKTKEDKEDLGLQHKDLHGRLVDHVNKEAHKPKETTPEPSKTEEIAKKKEELFKPEAKPVEKKPESPKKTSSRWTEADEAGRPGSKPTPKKETNKEEKIKKTGGGFFKKIFRPLRHPIRTARLLGRAAVTPIGLTTYKLADIGEKEKTGAKDRFNGFKKIAKGEKKKK